MDSDQLRQQQVEVVAQALSRFVALKSSDDEWQAAAPVSSGAAASLGGDIAVHIARKALGGGDVYRLTASIGLDAEASRDTQGPFSGYLSELRDWQAVLECPELRSQWNYFLAASTTLEMVDAHTAITRSQLRSPVPGQTGEFAHARDLLMVETSLVDPTTVVHVATSLPTTPDHPAYLRPAPPTKRVHSDLWAWCVEIATPLDATPSPAQRPDQPAAPHACIQVTCFLHLDLGTWAGHSALACRAAANLIPALVAHLRLQGAPPRLARIGPLLAVDRREWRRGPPAVWEMVYSAGGGARPSAAESQQQQPIIARVLDLEAADGSGLQHRRTESTLTTYLSSSLQRQLGEESAMGSHTGGIIRDGEEEAVVAMRARLSKCVVEFVVDATRWHAQSAPVDIRVAVRGGSGAGELQRAIQDMKATAPDLFSDGPPAAEDGDAHAGQAGGEGGETDRVVAQLVRCFTIGSHRGPRRRYLVRIVNPTAAHTADSDTDSPAAGCNDSAFSVAVSVCMGEPGSTERLLVNGQPAAAAPFTLGPAPPPPVHHRTARRRAKTESGTPASLTTPEVPGDVSQAESSVVSAVQASVEAQTGHAGGSCETPLERLRQACAIPDDRWEALGTAKGVTVARAVVQGGARDDPQHLPDGAILRATMLVDGWTVFDIHSVLRAGEAAGLWAEEQEIAQAGASCALYRCATGGTWAVAARDAVVVRAWTECQRSRAEIAEHSVDAPVDLPPISAREPIRADVGLAAWVVEKAALAHEKRRETGTPAVDAEEASRRSKQHAARLTYYLQISPRGWLDTANARDPPQPWLQPWLGPWLRSEMAAGVARVAARLEAQGAPPAVVWQRNSALLAGSGAGVRYRLAPWGSPSEDVEVELRIEHRVWAYGGTGSDGAAPASVALEITPYDAGATSVACFVDPEADPHATRVRVRHRRALLLPRSAVAEDGTAALAWPVVRVAVERASDDGSPAAVPARSWSVPPRVTVNGGAARVRFLRRECDSAFYARCQSVAASPRLVRAPGDPTVEPLLAAPALATPNPGPAQSAAAMAIRSYSVQPRGGPTVARPADFTAAVAHAFARIRHEIELLDPDSARTRWAQLRADQAGAAAAPRTRWTQHAAVGDVAVYERTVADIHESIPVTVACSVVRGASVAQVAQLLTQPWERARWDRELFAERRLVEAADGAGVWHSSVHSPALTRRRDALTVVTGGLEPHLPARQRLRNWQRRRHDKTQAGCGGGDYYEPAATLVEASVPGAQPLASAERAAVPLFAVRLDPVDGHERARGDGVPYPSTRVTVACCVDLAGSLPLPLRRVLSARSPVAQLRQIVARLRRPLWPRLEAPAPLQRQSPLHAAPAPAVRGEASEETVDGRPAVFYRALDPARIVCETLDAGSGIYAAAVRVAGARPASTTDAHVTSLRKARGAEAVPLLPVVSDITVDAQRFPRGFDVHVAVAQPGPSMPIARAAAGAPPAARAVVGGDVAVYVFGLDADHSAPLGGGGRQEGGGGERWRQLLVRTVLLPDMDADDCDLVCTVTIQAAHGRESPADIACNGQRLRVHSARPARRSLLLVDDAGGAILTPCADCGGIGCQEDTGAPAYASDTASEADGPVPRAGSHSASPLAVSRVPSAAALATVRRRIATPCEIPPTEPGAGSVAAHSANRRRRVWAARLLLAALSLAICLPLRRLAIGRAMPPLGELVRRWAAAPPDDTAAPKARPAAKSALALLLVLVAGAACVWLGVGVSRLVCQA